MYDKKQMFRATCANCGNKCEVPFKPSGDKPVLCRECFGNKNQGRGDRQGRSGDRGDRRMHQATCAKCGQNCEVPFRPSGDKPVYCSNCFSKDSGGRERHGGRDRREGNDRRGGGGGNDHVSKQLKSVNDKIDRVLTLLDPGVVLEKSEVEKKAGKFVPRKPVDKKKPAKKVIKKPAKKPAKKKK